jgi:hypothetical protein
MLVPLALLLLNEISKPFFWTPHLQIFNIFVPVLSLYLFRSIQERGTSLTWGHASGIGLLLGIASLAYGAFVVTAVGTFFSLLAGQRFPASVKESFPRLARGVLVLGCFVAPLAAWVLFVIWWNGSFYSFETACYRQFVWLVDVASEGGSALWLTLHRNVKRYLHTLVIVVALPVLLLAVVTAIGYILGLARKQFRVDRDTGLSILWYGLASIPFYALMGYYATRLSWTIVPALLVVLGTMLQQLRLGSGKFRAALEIGMVVLAACYFAYWIGKAGPYH